MNLDHAVLPYDAMRLKVLGDLLLARCPTTRLAAVSSVTQDIFSVSGAKSPSSRAKFLTHQACALAQRAKLSVGNVAGQILHAAVWRGDQMLGFDKFQAGSNATGHLLSRFNMLMA